MKSNFIVFIAICSACLMLSGCGKSSKPAGFPKTVPCTVTITKGGIPLEGCSILLVSKNSTEWTVAGTTDASGIAVIQTLMASYQQPGASIGSYTVILNKPVTVPDHLSDEERNKMSRMEFVEHSKKIEAERKKRPLIIPKSLTAIGTSKITFDVTKPDDSISIEVDDYK